MITLGLATTEKAADMVTRFPSGISGGTFGSGPFGALFGTMVGRVRESFAGAWQRNMELSVTDAMGHGTVWACVTLIATDVAKCWLRLVEEQEQGIFVPVTNSAYSPLLRKPNHYQTPYQFMLCWMLSLLTRGNTFVLKQRNRRGGEGNGNVEAMHVLDPTKVEVLVAPDSSVFYRLNPDNLAGIFQQPVVVPASEIIHDRMFPLYHPLIGLAPLTAAWLTALQGLRIQQQSENFFANYSQPGGLLMTPNPIGPEAARTMQEAWEAEFTGPDASKKIAVLGGGMTFTPLAPMTAEASQLVEQLKWGDERICACYQVPAYKVGVGPMPSFTNIQPLEIQYQGQALQGRMENIEQLLTDGLELANKLSIEFDLDAMFRMDTATLVKTTAEAVGGTLMTSNEGRKRLNLLPKSGGDAVLSQQQNFSLEALAERDRDKPFAKPTAPAVAPVATSAASEETDDEDKYLDNETFGYALLAKMLEPVEMAHVRT